MLPNTSPINALLTFLFRRKVRGASRLYSYLRSPRRLRVKTTHGLWLSLDPFEYIDSIVIRTGYYEIEVLNALLGLLRENDVFWDIGANLGLHGLTIAHERPDVSVVSFEPNPFMHKLLVSAAAENHLMITPSAYAISAENAVCDFYIHRGNLGMSGLHNWNSESDLETIKVESKTAEWLVNNGLRSPNVVKIDVEGHEAQVLAGFEPILDSIPLRAVLFEDNKYADTAAKQILAKHGFEIRPLTRLVNETSHNLENFIAMRSNR